MNISQWMSSLPAELPLHWVQFVDNDLFVLSNWNFIAWNIPFNLHIAAHMLVIGEGFSSQLIIDRHRRLFTVKKSSNDDYSFVFFFFSLSPSSSLITTSLTYEELVPFLVDPSWMRLRKICFTLCWITYLVIFMTACIISYDAARKSTCGIDVISSSGMIVEATISNSSVLPSVESIPIVSTLLSDSMFTAGI